MATIDPKPDRSPEPPEEKPGWFDHLANLGTAGVQNIVKLAKVVLAGQATPGQIAFFMVGVAALVCTVLGVSMAIGGKADLLVWVLAGLGVVTLIVVYLMYNLMRPPTKPAKASPEDTTTLRRQIEQLEQDRAALHQHKEALRAKNVGLQEGLTQATQKLGRAREWLEEIMETNTQIFLQGGTKLRAAVREQETTLRIDADGTLTACEKVTFAVPNSGQPAQMVSIKLFGETTVDCIPDLIVKAEGDGHHQVALLPASDRPTEKELLLFFLPFLFAHDLPQGQPSANATVTYIVRWQWRGLWGRFLRTKQDTWQRVINSSQPVPLVRFRFKLHPDLPRIALANLGDGGGRELQPSGMPDDARYREFVWEMTDVKPDSRIVIRLQA